MYQSFDSGGRDVPNFRLKFNVIFFSSVCSLMRSSFKHKCYLIMKFWLALHLRSLDLIQNNSFPKAESPPDYCKRILFWAKKYKECWDKELVYNHVKLYKALIVKSDPKDMLLFPTAVWTRVQHKTLDNKLRDFNWLVLHKRLSVSY